MKTIMKTIKYTVQVRDDVEIIDFLGVLLATRGDADAKVSRILDMREGQRFLKDLKTWGEKVKKLKELQAEFLIVGNETMNLNLSKWLEMQKTKAFPPSKTAKTKWIPMRLPKRRTKNPQIGMEKRTTWSMRTSESINQQGTHSG